MSLIIEVSKKFKKDLKRLRKQDKDLYKLENTVKKLASEEGLPSRYRDHYLVGNYTGYRECHIEPDWLLIYKIDSNKLLILTRTGTHSDLF